MSMVKRRVKWTEEEVIVKMQEWAAVHDGHAPAAADWHPSDCRRSARISAGRSVAWLRRAAVADAADVPWPRTVQRLFGSWNKAVLAAGLVPRPSDGVRPYLSAGTNDDYQRAVDLVERAEDPAVLFQALLTVSEAALAWAEEVQGVMSY